MAMDKGRTFWRLKGKRAIDAKAPHPDRGRDAGLADTPPSEPDLRVSRIRLSS
jgi:hypothetical protein